MKSCGTATGGWFGARLAGIAVSLLCSILVAAAATAAPGGEPGKPQSQPNDPQGTQDDPGSAQAQEVRTDPEPEPEPAPQSQSRAEPEPEPEPQPRSSSPDPEPQGPKSQGGSDGSQSAPNREAGTNGPNGSTSNPQGRGPSGWTTYCHSTRSQTNPFVVITTNDNGLPTAHSRHHDGDDIIPATNGECPGGTTPTTNERPTDGPDDGGPGGLNGDERIDGPIAPGEQRAPEDGVRGEEETSPDEEESPGDDGDRAPVAEEGAGGAAERALPFTGLGIGAILVLALLALAGGVATRRMTRSPDS